MTCVTYWIAVPHVVWKVRATLTIDWLLLDTLVTATSQKKKQAVTVLARKDKEILEISASLRRFGRWYEAYGRPEQRFGGLVFVV